MSQRAVSSQKCYVSVFTLLLPLKTNFNFRFSFKKDSANVKKKFGSCPFLKIKTLTCVQQARPNLTMLWN